MKSIAFWMLLFALVCTGCLPEDERIEPFDRGDLVTITAVMGSDYRDQVYVDLSLGEEVARNSKLAWDLELRTDEAGQVSLHLNSSKLMRAAITPHAELVNLESSDGWPYHIDLSNGYANETALSSWKDGKVFALDRGFNLAGAPLGYQKVKMEQLANGDLVLQAGEFDETETQSLQLTPPTPGKSLFLSLNDGLVQVDLLPEDLHWDLIFTQYTTLLPDGADTIDYLVTGTLLNPHATLALKDTSLAFDDIQANTFAPQDFTSARDVIGYDWKDVDISQIPALFTIEPGINYVLQTSTGFQFKFRFIDFYTPSGEKGAPTMEVQLL